MTSYYHATAAANLPSILKNGLCSPKVGGFNPSSGTEWFEKGTLLGRKWPSSHRVIYCVENFYPDAESIAFSFATVGGYPTIIGFNEVSLYKGRVLHRGGEEVLLVDTNCIPPDELTVWQYIEGKWKKIKRGRSLI